MHAILVCDDPDETAILTLILQRVGGTVKSVPDVERALKGWAQQPADLALLVLRQGAPPGEVRRLRAQADVPLALISATHDEDALCQLLEAGADLVVTRPYSARLLVAQLRALLRRSRTPSAPSLPITVVGKLTLDPSARAVQVNGHPPRNLTQTEFRLLITLMIHHGQTLPAETIVERVWGYGGEGSLELVRGLISRLRVKVEDDPKHPIYILTVPGVGYRLYVGTLDGTRQPEKKPGA